MTATLGAWAAFAVCAGAIASAGWVLCREGDTIAALTAFSRSWIGLVLLATVTSLPELVTGISSVAAANLPDIAVGNVLGATVLNLGVLGAVMVIAARRVPSASARAVRHASAAWGLALLGLALGGLLLARAGVAAAVGTVGLYTPAILVAYGAAMRAIHERDRAAGDDAAAPPPGPDRARVLRRAAARFALAAGVVALAGTALPFVSERLAGLMGWSHTYFGTLFVAVATTLPELGVTLAAMRMGAFDMAVANLLGSNLFDLAILAVDDLLFVRGPILAHVAPEHALTAATGLAMTAVVVWIPGRWAGWVLLAFYGAHVLALHGIRP